MASLSPLEMIERNAALVIESSRQQFGETLAYDQPSVEWLDGYIERLRQQSYADDDIDKLINVFGSFLGECIRHHYGGEWADEQNNWVIRFDANNAAFPFNKVLKQFKNGSEAGDSIASFYANIPILYADVLSKDDPQ